jgi:hypothetical protein
MNTRKLAAAVGLGLGLSLAGGVSQGALLSFEDDDVDFVLRAPGGVLNPTPVTAGPLQVGDILVSILEIPIFTIDGVNAIPAGQELTGVAVSQITSIVGAGAPGATVTFGPAAVGLNAILALGPDPDASVIGGGPGGPAAIALWFNSTADFDLELNRSVNPATNCPTLAFCIDQASMGTLVQVDAFNLPNSFWTATTIVGGGTDIGAILGLGNNVLVAGVNIGLGTTFNLFGPVGGIDAVTNQSCATPGVGTCVQVSISATITGGQGLENGGFAHSDFDAQKRTIPEPGILTLLGAVLLGFGFARRQRKG